MKFQLPTDKNERNKVLFMIGFVSIGILYAVITFGLLPYFARVRADRDRLAELDDLLWRADRDIRQTRQNLNRNIEIINEILDISETQRYILRPSLGNYLLVAESVLQQNADQIGVTIRNIRETSGPPPAASAATANQLPAFWPYAVSFTMTAGLHDFLQFVHTLQNNNPYVALISVSITAGPDNNPEQHAINATIQWPVWKDPDRPNRLAAELLADEEQ